MKIDGVAQRSVTVRGGHVRHGAIDVLDQALLPHQLQRLTLRDVDRVIDAIRSMQVRGAPLIGVVGAFGLAFALRDAADDAALAVAFERLTAARPTAVNLRWALERVRNAVAPLPPMDRAQAAWLAAQSIADDDVALNRALGAHGARLLRALHAQRGRPLQILTHCNAGWIATVDYGTALSAIYQAHDDGVPLHVWVDETRPRNQGLLTAWELGAHGVPHTLVVDNAGGHLMQHGAVDLVLVGADRVTARGDVCNKIGTYLKAVAAADNGVPFYAAVPSPTIDWQVQDALAEIPIEARAGDEVRVVHGVGPAGAGAVRLAPESVAVANPAFDVTPARLVTGIITERGVAAPADLAALFGRGRSDG